MPDLQILSSAAAQHYIEISNLHLVECRSEIKFIFYKKSEEQKPVNIKVTNFVRFLFLSKLTRPTNCSPAYWKHNSNCNLNPSELKTLTISCTYILELKKF